LIALDTDAVQSALGYDKVDYYGGSYGGVDVSAYATRFGQHLRSVVLDSPAGTPGLGPFFDRFASAAAPREVRLDCLRSPTCSADHRNPDAEFEQLIRTIRKHPQKGYAYDANGNLIPVNFDESALFYLVYNQSIENGAFVETGELGN
jgi:pimeloyl-ACP methyl ester carboxylesterase